jgi:hypothetical protein
VRVENIDRGWPVTETAASALDELVIVRGSASAVLCWLVGRAGAEADLAVTRCGRPCQLPRLQPWA